MSGRWIRFLGFLNAMVATVFGYDARATDYPMHNIYTAFGRPEPGTLKSTTYVTGLRYGLYAVPTSQMTGKSMYRIARSSYGERTGICTILSAGQLCGYTGIGGYAFCDDEYVYCDYETVFLASGCACTVDYESHAAHNVTGICWTGGDAATCQVTNIFVAWPVTEDIYYFQGCGNTQDPSSNPQYDAWNGRGYVKNLNRAYDTWYRSSSDMVNASTEDRAVLCAKCPEIQIRVPGESYYLTGSADKFYSDSVVCHYDRAGVTPSQTGQKDDIGIYDEFFDECSYNAQD